MSKKSQLLIVDDYSNKSKLDILSTDSSKSVCMRFDDPLEVNSFYLCYKDAPVGAEIHIRVMDSEEVVIFEALNFLPIEGDCSHGNEFHLSNPIYIEPDQRIYFKVVNGTTGADFSAWVLFNILRDDEV